MPEARTKPVNPFDSDFQQWVATTNPMPAPPQAPRRSRVVEAPQSLRRPDGDGGGGGNGGGGGGAGQGQLTSFHAYVNSRPNVDWNTCGQAAIASITECNALNPYNLPRVGQYWDERAAIDAVINGGFGSDVLFGWGRQMDESIFGM